MRSTSNTVTRDVRQYNDTKTRYVRETHEHVSNHEKQRDRRGARKREMLVSTMIQKPSTSVRPAPPPIKYTGTTYL